MKNVIAQPWSCRWLLQKLGAIILMIGALGMAAIAITTLIIALEQLIALIVVQRPINTYANKHHNATEAVIWHFMIVFAVISFWAALDTFTPEPK